MATLSFWNLDPHKKWVPHLRRSFIAAKVGSASPRVKCIIIYALSLVPNRLAAASGRASGPHRRAEGSATAPRFAFARRPAGKAPARTGGRAALRGHRRPAPHRHRPPVGAATTRSSTGSRRKRIACGSGTIVQEVNNLLRQYAQMRKMFKSMGSGGGLKAQQRMMSQMQGKQKFGR